MILVPLLLLGACAGTREGPRRDDVPPATADPPSCTLVEDTTESAPPAGCGTLEWVIQIAGWSTDDVVGMELAPDGGIVIAGTYDREMVFDYGGAAPVTLAEYCPFVSDEVFLAKYRTDGTLVWTARAGACSYMFVRALTIAPDGDILIAGTHDGGAPTFGVDDAAPVVLPEPEPTGGGLFVARYSPDGELRWVRSALSSSFRGDVAGVAVDAAGNTYVTGTYEQNLVLSPGTSEELTLTATPLEDIIVGNIDMWVASYDAAGGLRWAVTEGSEEEGEFGTSIIATASGIVAGAGISGPVTFGLESPNPTLLAGRLAGSAPFVRYSSTEGGFLGAAMKPGGSIQEMVLTGADTLLTTANLTNIPGTFGPGEPGETVRTSVGLYLAEYRSDGTLVSVTPEEGRLHGVAPLALAWRDGRSGVAGSFYETMTPGTGTPVQGVGYRDGFAATWNADGLVECIWTMGSVIGDDYARAITFDADGGVVVAGTFRRPLLLEEGKPERRELVPNNDSTDVFLARFHP